MANETRDDLLVAFAIALVATAYFALNVDFLMRGDASTYANYVLLSKFDDLTLHIGYYGTLWALDRSIGRLLGVPLHEMLVWLNVACGALALAVSYLLARRLLGSRAVALGLVGVLLLSGRVLTNATSSEIYMLQMLLVLLAMLAYAHARPAVAGALAGGALLVSPLSAFAFLFFPVFEFTRPAGQRRVAPLLHMFVAGTVVYAPYLLVHGEELFLGRRGLLVISEVSRVRPFVALRNVPVYQFKHYTALLLLLIPALLQIRRHTRFLILTAVVFVPHLYIVLKLTGENNVFLLNTDFFFAGWVALGAHELWERGRTKWLAPLPVLVHAVLLLWSRSVFHGVHNREYAADMREIARAHLVGKEAVLVGDWDVIMSLTYFERDSATAILEEEPLARQLYDIDKPATGQPSLAVRDILLLDPWSPGALRTLLESERSVDAVRERIAVVNKAKRLLGLSCVEIDRRAHVLYRCAKSDSAPSRAAGDAN